MVEFQYKTKGKSSPQGKSSVFFCCHPDDFDLFFESISDEILQKQNCTIWYSKEDFSKDESFFDSLKQMNLFIIPVTRKLLFTENIALDVIFKFAIENHIPVLPLMQESGLAEAFNFKCGELQYLDKYTFDATAISYEDKLEKFLASVLVGDELADKIRAAFDAYIFLSYRKKDRAEAQELMRLIHKNDFCRDIAIWYDEYLKPGENFNDAIKTAICKSDLFMLAVTPNLVNESNYIVSEEYPFAKGEGKPILPVELVDTDKKQLEDNFDNIPDCVNGKNETELSEVLLENISKIAIKENDGSPEHNFFIGLAYLTGIDVEIDHERAFNLIKDSAKKGLHAAYEKIVSMYRVGLGVEKNNFEATMWQDEYAKMCYDRYNSNPTIGTLTDVTVVYRDLGKYYCELNMFDDAQKAYNTSLDAAKSLVAQDDSRENQEYLLSALNRLCLMAVETSQYSQGEEYIEEVIGLYEELYKDINTVDKAIYHINASVLYRKPGFFEKSIEYSKKAINVLTSINDETSKLALYSAYMSMGGTFYEWFEYDSALEYYEKAIDIIKQLRQETGEKFLNEVAFCSREIALVKSQLKLHEEALKAAKRANSIYKKLLHEQKMPKYIQHLVRCQNTIGLVYLNKKDNENAKKHFRFALECYSALEEYNSDFFKNEIAAIKNNLAVILMAEKDYTSACTQLEEARKILIEIVNDEQSFLSLYSQVCCNLSVCYYSFKDFKQSEDYARESLRINKSYLHEGLDGFRLFEKDFGMYIGAMIRQGYIIKGIKTFVREIKLYLKNIEID